MGDSAAVTLSDALRTNTSLKYLIWDRNNVDLGGYQVNVWDFNDR
jgi:hypothetical protein